MKGQDLKNLRQRMGLERLQFARMLGYTGTDRNDITRIRSYENGKKQVPLYIARLAWLIEKVLIAERGTPPIWQANSADIVGWPSWPGYEFQHTPDPQHKESDHGFY